MPNKKSAMKRLRQDKKKHEKNKGVVSEIRTLVKKTRVLITDKNREKADITLRTLESKIDKAAKSNVIKKNNASRRVSRLRQQWSKIESKA